MARPQGEKSQALLEALDSFLKDDMNPTLPELAHRALVSSRDAKTTLGNLVRAGQVVITGSRRVHYRNKPVAEYGRPAKTDEAAPVQALTQALNAWRW